MSLRGCINCSGEFETDNLDAYVLCPACTEIYPGEEGQIDKYLEAMNTMAKHVEGFEGFEVVDKPEDE